MVFTLIDDPMNIYFELNKYSTFLRIQTLFLMEGKGSLFLQYKDRYKISIRIL